MARSGRRAAALGLIAVLTALALVAADAATLGGLTPRTLASFDVNGGAGAPTIVGCDNFTGTNGTTLNGRPVTVAANCANRTWLVTAGTWTIQGNQAAANGGLGSAIATLNTNVVDATATVTLTGLTSGQVGGVVLNHNGGSGLGANFMQALVIAGAPSRIELRIFSLGVALLPVAAANVTLAASNTLAVKRVGTTVTVTLNGTVVITYGLIGTEPLVLSGGRAGIVGATTGTRFDDVVVTVP